MQDCLVHAQWGDGEAQVIVAVTGDTAREACQRHGASGVSAVAVAKTATAAVLLGGLKRNGKVSVQFIGKGPAGHLLGDADAEGNVRVYMQEAVVLPAPVHARLSTAPVLGTEGIVHVLREPPGGPTFSSQTALVSGEIDQDVEHFLTTSDQTDSAVGCEATLGADGNLLRSAGVLLQALPGANVAAMLEVARCRMREGVLWEALRDTVGDPVEPLLRALLGDGAARIRELERSPVRFKCSCSRDRVVRTLSLMPLPDLESLRDEGGTEVTCRFCRESYALTAQEVADVLARRLADDAAP